METVFRIKYGFFEILIMNFGFCGIPSAFQNYIKDILHEHLDIFCSAYIDDILIYNKTKTLNSLCIFINGKKSNL